MKFLYVGGSNVCRLVGILAEVLIHDKSVNASTVYRTPVLSEICIILMLVRIG